MSKLNKKNFLRNFSSHPNFHRKILEQGGVEWSLIRKNPEDYYAANSGAVPGMIYYTDTVAFGKKHHLPILQVLEEFESECGKLENKPSPQDEIQYYNWLAWFSWENMMSEVMFFMETEN
jgi:hypothetical protein